MAANALYFPYINVPNSTWFSRLLLYWDSVSAIIPYEYSEDPGLLDRHTRDLLRADLVHQVWPGQYTSKIPRFVDDFIEYLEGLGDIRTLRLQRFASTPGSRIHFEKLADLGRELELLGLARRIDDSWFEVEVMTGDEFMAYLASAIASVDEQGLSPITDDVGNLSSFLGKERQFEARVEPLRVAVLRSALPAPRGEITVDDIRSFKDKHHDRLFDFRNWVETELGRLAAIHDPELHERQLKLLNERVIHETEDIKQRMRDKHWLDFVCGDLCSVIRAIPAVGMVPKVVNAFYKLIRSPSTDSNSPLAYAAWAQKELRLGGRSTE